MAYFDILLPVKNGETYLAAALGSIRAQTFVDWRLLILDHGSTDRTLDIAESHARADGRIQICSLPAAEGLSGLLNAGLDLCDARYVIRHDSDDIALPERLSVTKAAFDAHPELVVIGGQVDNMDEHGAPVPQDPLPTEPLRIAAAMLFCNPVAHPAVGIRLDAFRKLGARYGVEFGPDAPIRRAAEFQNLVEDYYLFGQLAILGLVGNIPHKVIRYRIHEGGVSRQKLGAQMAASQKVSARLAARLCDLHGVAHFDPTPFCNHGAMLFDMGAPTEFHAEFAAMQSSLDRIFGTSPAVQREMRYRRVLASRHRVKMLTSYAAFRSFNRPVMNEELTVKLHLAGKKGPRAMSAQAGAAQ